MNNIKILYQIFILPKSKEDDESRRELIFNLLLAGFVGLTVFAFFVSSYRYLSGIHGAEHVPPYHIGLILLVMLAMFAWSRVNFNNYLVIFFLSIYYLIATYALFSFGYVLTQGILIYVLVIVVSGILVSSNASLIVTLLSLLSLIILRHLQLTGVITPNTSGLGDPLNSADIIIYSAILIVIFLTSWISSSEIERSLKRARHSEELLKQERDQLEETLKKRTRELEISQAEKTIELYRFAEYGRLSASLLHDLANPLTSVSINFEELSNKTENNETMTQMHEGIKSMNDYVSSARSQLQKEHRIKRFDVSAEINKLLALQQNRITKNKIKCDLHLHKKLIVYGDCTKFDQLVANLLSNSLDALEESSRSKKHVKLSTTKSKDGKNFTLLIADNGSGIPNNKLDKIFKPFYTSKSKSKGTGIGLSIVKNVVDEYGGSISVRSSKNGTEFTVRLPSISLKNNNSNERTLNRAN